MRIKTAILSIMLLGVLTSCSAPFQLITGNVLTGGGIFARPRTPLYQEDANSPFKMISIEIFGEYGDATLIDFGDVEILIDGATKETNTHLDQVLTQYVNDHRLEMLVVTHAHSDHLAGLDEVGLNNINQIDYIIDYGYQGVTSSAHAYVAQRVEYINNGSRYYPITSAIEEVPVWQMTSSLRIEFLNTNNYLLPEQVTGEEGHNIHSIATLISYGNWRIFLAGDLETSGERYLATQYAKRINERNLVIMKANHHGGLTNNNGLELFNWLKPDYVFISAALKNSNLNLSTYTPQHPEAAFVRRALSYTEEVYWNAINGDLSFALAPQALPTISGAIRHQIYKINYQTVDPVSEKDSRLTASAWYQAYLAI
ncbi:MAG: hypothetical protein WCR35_00630 [Bacilli bacterium]